MILQFIGQTLKPVFHVREKSVDYVESRLSPLKLQNKDLPTFQKKKKNSKIFWGEIWARQTKAVSLLKDFSDPLVS